MIDCGFFSSEGMKTRTCVSWMEAPFITVVYSFVGSCKDDINTHMPFCVGTMMVLSLVIQSFSERSSTTSIRGLNCWSSCPTLSSSYASPKRIIQWVEDSKWLDYGIISSVGIVDHLRCNHLCFDYDLPVAAFLQFSRHHEYYTTAHAACNMSSWRSSRNVSWDLSGTWWNLKNFQNCSHQSCTRAREVLYSKDHVVVDKRRTRKAMKVETNTAMLWITCLQLRSG